MEDEEFEKYNYSLRKEDTSEWMKNEDKKKGPSPKFLKWIGGK